ncbi:MAG: tol-pal system-associated acyl-CoA thioesterase [Rhodanobacter sp.]|jgi:acyl-CoA thioester hydrolase|nr:tol-pal system-associated acyl-CoA thioesterase [Rhodanobacter sp.]MBN8947162.1 tol-pal system-associated acyl-CoA thioesterase [Rhodanobacter sp.]ODT94126.1 MAG: tol-pal system-associated acyl-CoA thioesterase [Rhodanobacter sp. SCN 67-45]OJW41873.1 MAG: tol-pal system-associated acyl-CoA thioesterase [Rhodanobacter sp. 67-28]
MPELAAEPPFSWKVRVYWEDTDAGGVVYHAGYLRFMERARSEWMRALGVDQMAYKQATGLAFMVRDMHIDFLRPALLDDELSVTVEVKERRAASILFAQTIMKADGKCLVRASVRVACVELERMRPAAIPPDLIPQPEA